MSEPRQTFEQVAGCRVHVQRAGKGDPLLFLHGAAGVPHWFPFLESLAERFDVIVPEHPGFGLSDTPPWLDHVSDVAYFYLDFLEGMKLGRVHLLGNSLGGWIAAEMAVRSQERLRTLTLVSPGGIHVRGVPPGDIFLWSPEETVRNLFYDSTLAESILQRPTSEEEQDRQLKNRFAMARLAWQPRLHNPDLEKWLHRITAPTLLVWGDSDRVMPPAYGPAFQRLIPNSTLRVLACCGHLPQIERAPEFVSAVVDFIGRQP